MKTYTASDGNKYLILSVSILTDRNRFAQALTEHFYRQNIEEIPVLKKNEAKKIFAGELKWFGISGEYGTESLGSDNIDEYNSLFDQAVAWLDKNYPNI